MLNNDLMSAIAICTYRVKKGKENEFLGLLRGHWPALRDVGLAEDTPSTVYRLVVHKR